MNFKIHDNVQNNNFNGLTNSCAYKIGSNNKLTQFIP